jgi:pyruvate dehydrogenase E2 component (dihydrolipoamide acetyltransferase)
MATDVILPQWGMNMEEGTLVRWLKHEGDEVTAGEPLVEIETAKINDSLESPAAGVLKYVLIPEGQTVAVRTVLAIIAAPGEEVARPGGQPGTPAAGAAATSSSAAAPPVTAGAQVARAAAQVVPAARRLASELGIDLAMMSGTGPGGRILEDDVRAAATAQAQPVEARGATGAAAPLTGMRKTIAERMTLSVRSMAQVTLTTEADVSAAVELRRQLVSDWREHRMRPVDQDIVLMAVARALRENPYMNATLDERGLQQHPAVNLGVALALPVGLVVGVVRDTASKDIVTVAREVRALTDKARDGSLGYDEVTGSTFTVSSLAQFDIDAFSPLVNPPEVGILGVGRIVEKPVGFDGQVVLRSMLHLSLTFDHRAVDGAPAAQFLQTVVRHLNQPGWMRT